MIPRLLTYILIAAVGISAQAQTFTGKVVEVIDGNTFKIIDEYDEESLFILSEADSPEIGQELGAEAREFSADLILKKKVVVERVGKDWLGNKLAIISLKNGTLLHEELINRGLAWADRKASASSNQLMTAAQAKKLGVWALSEPTAPWIYRRQQTMMQAKSR